MRLLPSLGGERSLSRKPDGPDTLGAVRFLRRDPPTTTVGRTWSQFSLVCAAVDEAADADRGVYRFEELGWLEFERVANALLAGHPGLDEARWSGRADEGRVAVMCGDAELPGVGPVAGPVLVLIAWSPAVPREPLHERARDLTREAGLTPRSALVITNASEGDQDASAWPDALEFIPKARRLWLGP